jgi:hypothetical protein
MIVRPGIGVTATRRVVISGQAGSIKLTAFFQPHDVRLWEARNKVLYDGSNLTNHVQLFSRSSDLA